MASRKRRSRLSPSLYLQFSGRSVPQLFSGRCICAKHETKTKRFAVEMLRNLWDPIMTGWLEVGVAQVRSHRLEAGL